MPNQPSPAPKIYQAILGTGGDVVRRNQISEAQAIVERQASRDVVVCGQSLVDNYTLAEKDRNSGERQLQTVSAAFCNGPRRVAAFSTRSARIAAGPHVLRDRQTQVEESKEAMKYFTPELYRRFHSPDRNDVVKAHDDWEAAIESYRRQLKEIGPKMTANSRQLANTLCLHDADYLGMAVLPTPDAGKPLAVLLTRQDAARSFLVYLLADQPLTRVVDFEWPFSTEQVHWLYDEFDIDENGLQRHEILLSNGQIVTLRFFEVQFIQHKVEEPVLV